MMMEQTNQRGFALPVAVFALVVIGVIMTGGFFMARQEGRIGVASEHAGLAFYLTEQGLVDVMDNWSSALFGSLANWEDTTITRDYAGTGRVTARVTKMTDLLYFVDVDGTVTRGGAMLSGASRRIGVTVRMRVPDLEPPAALTTRGPTQLSGSAEVHGEDEVPAGLSAECTDPLEDKPGILSDDTSQVSTGGASVLSGSPEKQEDPTISEETFTQFGEELSWTDLTQMADIRLTGGNLSTLAPDSTAGGACNSGQAYPDNWGNPLNPGAACSEWFPIIYVNGSARLQGGGVGQGILLVEGDLDLRGSFVFYGIIIVQGAMGTQGSGNRVYGGVMAANATFDAQALVGGSVVTNSTCAAKRAVINNDNLNRVRPLASRSWVDLSAISGS